MKIRGKKIEIISATVRYESYGKKQMLIKQTVGCCLIVDGVEKTLCKKYKKPKDPTDLRAKVDAFLRGETITEITI